MKLEELTLKDVSLVCWEHQRFGRDCETCSLYEFCMKQLTTTYPSGWKLDGEVKADVKK